LAQTGEHGLKKDAISFSDGLTIALASTAPAYSLAAVIGSIVVIVGFQAPAALLVSFVPMFFIAAAFYYLNRADQDYRRSPRESHKELRIGVVPRRRDGERHA
jgi:uncharacterized membrane protein YfcA